MPIASVPLFYLIDVASDGFAERMGLIQCALAIPIIVKEVRIVLSLVPIISARPGSVP
jgi:hypothetical protein